MPSTNWCALMEENGRMHIFEIVDEKIKIKGLGVFNPVVTLNGIKVGDEVGLGQKILTRVEPRLPEMINGMLRRAQTISGKDAGQFITRLGLGPGDTVLEAGLGSAGSAMHIARILGNTGHHITVEPREEHAESIKTCYPFMSKGARLACYAPTTIQLEAAWDACEEIGLTIEWAGEVIERPWSRASKGGLKPSKGDFGHTAFLLFAKK